MVLTNRRLDGVTAEQWGLVTRCSPELDTVTMATARHLASSAPLALNMAKTSLMVIYTWEICPLELN